MMQNIKPLKYDRNKTHIAGELLHSVTDEQARKWARRIWDRKFINYEWHPAYVAACEELRNENT